MTFTSKDVTGLALVALTLLAVALHHRDKERDTHRHQSTVPTLEQPAADSLGSRGDVG
jgi:hypothetical protein